MEKSGPFRVLRAEWNLPRFLLFLASVSRDRLIPEESDARLPSKPAAFTRSSPSSLRPLDFSDSLLAKKVRRRCALGTAWRPIKTSRGGLPDFHQMAFPWRAKDKEPQTGVGRWETKAKET